MDEKIKILIDESIILPDNFIHKYNIGVIPIKIMDSAGEEWTYKKREEIIDGLKKGLIFRTSAPPPSMVVKILEKEKDKRIISFHVSSELSGIVNVMKTVERKFENLIIVDTQTAGPASGMGVLAGLKVLSQGKNIDTLIKASLSVAKDTLVYMAVPETLRLARVRPVEGIKRFIQHPSLFVKFLRTPFGFPIVTIEKGRLKIYDFSRSFENACLKMMDGVLNYIYKREGKVYLFLFYSRKDENARSFKEKILKKISFFKFYEGEVGRVPLCAIGLNSFGVAVYKGNIELI